MSTDELILSQGEKGNNVARKIARELERRLQLERESNDHIQHDAVKTAHIRGRIALLKDLIALVKDDTPAL